MLISSGAISARAGSKSSNNLERKGTRKVTINSEGGRSNVSKQSPNSMPSQIMAQLWAMEGKLAGLEEQLAQSSSHLYHKLDDLGSRLSMNSIGSAEHALASSALASAAPASPPSAQGPPRPEDFTSAADASTVPSSPKRSPVLSPRLAAFAPAVGGQPAPPKIVTPAAAPACIAGSLPTPSLWLPPLSERSQASLPLPSGDHFTIDAPLWENPQSEMEWSDLGGKAQASEATERPGSPGSPGKAGRRSSLDSIEDLKAMTNTHSSWRLELWHTLDDPESGFWGKAYALGIPYVIFASVFLAMLQSSNPPLLQGAAATVANVLFELVFLTEFCLRLISCPTKRAFVMDYNNLIDAFVVVPLFIRTALGFRAMEGEQCGSICVALMCFVPLLRSLKILRRFENLPLLVDALEKAAEGLPVCLFVLFVLILLFSPLIYLVEPRTNVDSMPTAMWLTIVTMTTVGYGDITPETTLGSMIVSALVVVSVLYMAMPLGIVGNAFTEVWQQRDFILLRYRTKAKFVQWGFSAEDVPALFKMFTVGDAQELELHEFREMMSEMRIGLSGKRVVQLFEALDEDCGGSIDDREFVKKVFPEAFRAIYSMEMSERGSSG